MDRWWVFGDGGDVDGWYVCSARWKMKWVTARLPTIEVRFKIDLGFGLAWCGGMGWG